MYEFKSYDEVMACHQLRLERAAQAALVRQARACRPRAGIMPALVAFWHWLVGYEVQSPAPIAVKKG